jgi:hypothetical protein
MASPVTRPICPIMINREIPAKKPARIGRDRKFASAPSPTSRAPRQARPARTAMAEAAARRSAGPASGIAATATASDVARTVIVAASGPTISLREWPNSA